MFSVSFNILTWHTHGETDCPDCSALAGNSAPESEWQIKPGFHPHCDCSLDVSGTVDIPYFISASALLSLLIHIANRYGVSVQTIQDGYAAAYALTPRPEPVPAPIPTPQPQPIPGPSPIPNPGPRPPVPQPQPTPGPSPIPAPGPRPPVPIPVPVPSPEPWQPDTPVWIEPDPPPKPPPQPQPTPGPSPIPNPGPRPPIPPAPRPPYWG